MAKEIQLPGAFFLGAGAVSSRVVGCNAEVSQRLPIWYAALIQETQDGVVVGSACIDRLDVFWLYYSMSVGFGLFET